MTAPRSGRLERGVLVREGLVDPRDRVVVDGVRCTSIARTALDLARGRPLAESLVVLDAAVQRVPVEDLTSAYGRLPGRRGLRALAEAMSLADPRSESPLESASRGVIIHAGLPLPELQAWLTGVDGRAHRVDFLWRAHRVIGEADGWASTPSSPTSARRSGGRTRCASSDSPSCAGRPTSCGAPPPSWSRASSAPWPRADSATPAHRPARWSLPAPERAGKRPSRWGNRSVGQETVTMAR